ncbi:unnamed protein product [Parnassius mnemosyne]|uniref:Uncharacterized protein n=1 Tax=Parnassius mnemosyne TaxID=213953 RepID=A0AAV1KWV8_9NEOP
MAAKTSDWRPGPTVCRCCLAEGCYKDISTEYFWMGKREVYAEMLAETFDLSIAYSQSGGPNSNSRLICEPCISRLRDAADFKRQVVECEKMFLQHLDPSSSSLSAIEITAEEVEEEKELKIEQVKEEKLGSDEDFDDGPHFGDDDDDDLDDQPLTKLASKLPKKESVDLLDLIDNAKVAEKRKSTVKVKATPIKKVKLKKETKASASKAKPEKKKKGIIQVTNSSLILKDDDGFEIKLAVLKKPIRIDNLICQYEESADVVSTEKALNKVPRLERDVVREEAPNHSMDDKSSLMVLKEPISLDDIGIGEKFSVRNLTTRKILTGNARPRKKIVQERQTWKQNALTMFEFSYVYPFVHASNKFKCYVCSKPFVDANILREHFTNDHSFDDLRQEIGNKVRDKTLKVDVARLQCKLCHNTFTSLKDLIVHLRDHGKKIEPDFQDHIIPFKLGDDIFVCQICGENYRKLRLLIIHMSKHFNNYSCEMCGSVFISINLLKRHLQTHTVGSYPCEKCDKVFTNSAKRISHIRGVHLKQCPRTCPLCPERFNSNYQRSKHLRIFHNQPNMFYRCETCGRQYDLKYQLHLHKRSVHMQERNHECGICHSRFFSKYCLSRHMVIHTGDKKFKCEVCGKAYARKKNLREHTRSHNVEQVSCSVCGRTFCDHATLMIHMNTIHSVI